MINHKDG
jgi:hypothetical protein